MKIRFIKKDKIFYIERKTWRRWKRIGYWQGSCSGGSVWQDIYGFKKKETLSKALKYLKLREDTTTIVEFPSIKIY